MRNDQRAFLQWVCICALCGCIQVCSVQLRPGYSGNPCAEGGTASAFGLALQESRWRARSGLPTFLRQASIAAEVPGALLQSALELSFS